MKQLSDKNKQKGFNNPQSSSNTGEESWDEILPEELADTFQRIILAIIAILLISIGSYFLFFRNKKEVSSLPIGGCFYFSKTDYKEIIAWRNKHTPTVYYHTINGREYTFYTQDAKEINAYKRKFPDAIEIDCYDSSDTLIQKVWKK